MTSINTNTAAMSALQTLRGVNSNLAKTQDQISSGLRIGSAADNAAYWSIATTMRSDNTTDSAVADALGLGAATADTAYQGMNSAIDLVTQLQSKIVAAQAEGVDKAKIQGDISQLQSQLKTIAASASFSGQNWLQADLSTDDTPIARSIVGSFARDATGNVAVGTIGYTQDSSSVLFDTSGGDNGLLDKVATTDTTGAKLVDVSIKTGNFATTTQADLVAEGGTYFAMNVNLDSGTQMQADSIICNGDVYMRKFDASGQQEKNAAGIDLWTTVTIFDTASTDPADQEGVATHQLVNFVWGDHGTVQSMPTGYLFYADPVDTSTVSVTGLSEADISNISGATINGNTATIGSDTWIRQDPSTDVWVKASPAASASDDLVGVDVDGTDYDIDQTNTKLPAGFVAGNLGFSISDFDVTKASAVGAALNSTGSVSDQESRGLNFMLQYVDNALQAMTSAAANLGSISSRIDLQSKFVSSLRDSISSGVGKLVDADMEHESSKLSAIQTQQQLAIQSLSIANSSSQSIMTLFR